MTRTSMTKKHWRRGQERTKGHIMTGVAIATVGFVWLVNNVGWVPAANGISTILWPSVMIASGVTIVLVRRRHRTSEGPGQEC